MPVAPAAAGSLSAELTLVVAFALDGRPVEVAGASEGSLLDALREELGIRSVKDGCSPQGQCGCCTVLIDGVARVACVTPLRRVAGRSVTTADGLDPEAKTRLVDAFGRHGASQCGFCTPGILCRLAPLGPRPPAERVESALLAHLCRCTGWRTILAAACEPSLPPAPPSSPRRWPLPATHRPSQPRSPPPGEPRSRGAQPNTPAPTSCSAEVDLPPTAPRPAVWSRSRAEAAAGRWARRWRRPGPTPARCRDGGAGSCSAIPSSCRRAPWDFTLQTTWVEPGYLELDSSWCVPGGQPAHPAANGGAFGGKVASPAPAAARALADRYHRPVQVLFSREDVVRQGPKRPPAAAGMRVDGTGHLHLVAAPGVAALARAVAPGLEVIEFTGVIGPPVSGAIRAAGWAEAAVLLAAGRALAAGRVPGAGGVGAAAVSAPEGGWAEATVTVDPDGCPLGVEVTLVAATPSTRQ